MPPTFENPPDAPEPTATGSGLPVAVLVLGGVALATSPLLGGLVFGLVGLVLAVPAARRGRPRRGLALAGAGLAGLGLLASVAAGTLYLWLFSQRGDGEQPRTARRYAIERFEGQPVPALTLETVDGRRIDLADLRGRRVLINFWATWCAPCRAEIPHLVRLAGDDANGDVVVIGISDESKDTVVEFARRSGMTYALVADTDSESLPAPFDTVTALPTTVVVGRDGVLRRARVGGLDYGDLRALIAD